MKVIQCHVCREYLPPEDPDDTCVGLVPEHAGCLGSWRTGTVYAYNPEDGPPADYKPPKNQTDPRFRKKGTP